MDALIERLDRLAEAGTPARFWLRDDDAVAPNPALDRLFDVAGDLPLTLAVIPEPSGVALAERLARVPRVEVAVHGWTHANHAPFWAKPQELGPHRPAARVLDDLARGLTHLAALHRPRLVPLCVPPWNRIAPAVVEGLAGLGFRALSVFGPEEAGPLPQMNAHVDIIDWRGTRGGRAEAALVGEILARIESGGPVGVMTHHKVHDGAAWAFLTRLFAATRAHPGCRWLPASALIG